MTRSSRDPDLENLAGAVQQTRRTKRRPPAAANTGPVVAIVMVALVVGASVAVYWVTRGRATNTAAASPEPTVTRPVVEPKGSDVMPMRAMTSPRTAAAADEQAVLVTVVWAKVGAIELFPVKKAQPPSDASSSSPPPASQSKLFGKIPEPEERPQMSDPMLAIRVRIQNKSAATIEYRPWNDAAPVLADEAGNVYGFCHFTNAVPEGRVSAPKTLRSGESAEDLLIFQRPPATIRSLELHLPGKNVGAPQPILISISPSQMTGL